MVKNEKTSSRVATIAGKILQTTPGRAKGYVYDDKGDVLCSIRELKALAASALTQTIDKKGKKK